MKTKDKIPSLQSSRNFFPNCLSIIFVIWTLGLSYPYKVPLAAIATTFVFIAYTASNHRGIKAKLVSELSQISRNAKFLIAAHASFFLLFLISALPHYGMSVQLNSSVHRGACFGMFYLIFLLEVRPSILNDWLKKTAVLLTLVFAAVSVLGMLKYFQSFSGTFIFNSTGREVVWSKFTTSLVRDYNMYALGGLIGLLACASLNIKRAWIKWPLLTLLTLNVYLTGSRRGLIVLVVLFSVWLVSSVVRSLRERLLKSLIQPFVVVGLIVFSNFLTTIFHNGFSPQSKRFFFESLGMEYRYIASYMPVMRYRYGTIFNRNANLDSMRLKYYSGEDHIAALVEHYIPQLIEQKGVSSSDDPMMSSDLGVLLEYRDGESLDEKSSSTFKPTDGSRLGRYKYALTIFSDYTTLEKLFGSGFRYHTLYQRHFGGEDSEKQVGSDYPHQPLLSILLFSGILGLTVFCVTLVYFYFYRLLYTSAWFWMAFSVFFFCFFSMDIPFTYYLFLFFWMLPAILARAGFSKSGLHRDPEVSAIIV